MQDKLDPKFSYEILSFCLKMGLPIFGGNCPEPGLGSARIGFLAKSYVGYLTFSAQTAVWLVAKTVLRTRI